MIIIGGQIRVARTGLKWTQQELARKAQVSVGAVRRIEGLLAGPRGSPTAVPRTRELLRIIAVFKEAGLKFVNGGVPGVVFPDGVGMRLCLKTPLARLP